VDQIVLLLVLILLGYILKRSFSIDILFNYIIKTLFYIVIPLTVFFSTLRSPNIPILLISTVIAFIHLVIMLITSFSLVKLLPNISYIDRITIATLVSLPNSLFLAIPLSIILFNDALPVLPHAIAFNAILVLTILLLSTITELHRKRIDLRTVLPYLKAFLLGLLLKSITSAHLYCNTYIETIVKILNYINYSAFLVLGGELIVLKIKYMKEVLYIIPLKFFLSPLVLISILIPINTRIYIPINYIHGLLLQSLMPPAITNIVIAKIYKLNSPLTTLSIAFLTPLSIIIVLLFFTIL